MNFLSKFFCAVKQYWVDAPIAIVSGCRDGVVDGPKVILCFSREVGWANSNCIRVQRRWVGQ